jgi:hypothetical protein
VAKKKSSKAINREEMAANYGWALSFLKSNQELWKLFNKAVDKNYSVNRFVASLRNTKWYRHHSEAWRKSQVLYKTDPATYRQQRGTVRAKVSDLAVSMGADLTAYQRNRISANAQWFGWSDEQLRNTLATYVDQMGKSGHYGGEAGKAEQELRQYAHDQGVGVNDKWLKGWLKKIVSQRQTTDDYKAWLQHQAELTFPSLSSKIKQGVTVKDIANPYIQSMAQTLELDEGNIDLSNGTIRKALQPSDKGDLTPLWKFEQNLRQDPRWLKTNNARTSLVGSAQQVLKDWGFQT